MYLLFSHGLCWLCLDQKLEEHTDTVYFTSMIWQWQKIVSEWLLFNANSAIFQLNHGDEQVNFQWDDEVRFVLDKHAWLNFIVLAHWNNSPHVDISPHWDTLSWFRAHQSLLLLLSGARLAEQQQILIAYSLVSPDPGSNPPSTALEASTFTITPPMQLTKIIFTNML